MNLRRRQGNSRQPPPAPRKQRIRKDIKPSGKVKRKLNFDEKQAECEKATKRNHQAIERTDTEKQDIYDERKSKKSKQEINDLIEKDCDFVRESEDQNSSDEKKSADQG